MMWLSTSQLLSVIIPLPSPWWAVSCFLQPRLLSSDRRILPFAIRSDFRRMAGQSSVLIELHLLVSIPFRHLSLYTPGC